MSVVVGCGMEIMNKTARHAFRIYVAARNLKSSVHCTAWTCYSRAVSLSYSSYSKDHGSRLTPITTSAENDVILQALLAAKTADEIFETVKVYRPLLKSQHSLQAIKMLDSMHRLRKVQDLSIAKKFEFLQLCEALASDIKSLDVNDAVVILKAFSYLGVPSTSVISQSLLQLIRHSLSHLAFYRLVDLDHQLKDFEKSPLSDALKIAIPILCEIQINNKMIDMNDIDQLTYLLYFLRQKSIHAKSSTEMVINALCEKGQNMNAKHAESILKCLADLEYLPPRYEEVLSNVQRILTRHLPQMSFYRIQIMLSKIHKKVVYFHDKTFYNEELMDACASVVISEDFGFEEGVRVLRILCHLDHTQIRLIDYLAAKCFENPAVLNTCPPDIVMELVIGLATADYKPIFWESMQEIILQNIKKDKYKHESSMLDFTISMAVFDCYDSGLLKKTFAEGYLRKRLSNYQKITYWKLLLLHQSVQLFYSAENILQPPQYLLEAAMKANGPSVEKSSLLPALEKAMGGSQYVLSDLKSKLGHHIDHAVIMRKGGYPVALNMLSEETRVEPIMYVEDLQLPTESQVIIVINMPTYAYAQNSHRLKGEWTLLLKTLEIQTTHTVIPISSITWKVLMDHEKIPYLMQAIRLKCDGLSAFANI